MGIYMFEWPCLAEILQQIVATKQGIDFGLDIMARMLGSKRVVAHRFRGYWRDVGTVSSFFSANMDALDPESGLDLDNWEICTRGEDDPAGDRPPAWFGPRAECHRSLVSDGCTIEGSVSRSVLSPNVRLEPGARVEDSILMGGTTVGRDAHVRRAVVDKQVWIGPGVELGGGREEVPNKRFHKCMLGGISVIGKAVRIPAGIHIGSNVVVESGVHEDRFMMDLPDGGFLGV